MIRLTAAVSDHGFTYTLVRDGHLVCTLGNRAEIAEQMAAIGIDGPGRLIEAAEQWGVVEIREPAAYGHGDGI